MRKESSFSWCTRACARAYRSLLSLLRPRQQQTPARHLPQPPPGKDSKVCPPGKTVWNPPPATRAPSPSVRVAALDVDIMVVDRCVRKLFRVLHGTTNSGGRGGDFLGMSSRTPGGRAFLQRQLEELMAEKARYKEEKLALLDQMEPRRHSRLPSSVPADHKAVERTTALWLDAVTMGTYDGPRRVADLYARDAVLWGTEVFAPLDEARGATMVSSEVVRDTPEQIYAYFDCFARLPGLRLVEFLPQRVRVYGDFAAQTGIHIFAWRRGDGGEGGEVEVRARFSFTFRRRDDGDCGRPNAWMIVEHCCSLESPEAAVAVPAARQSCPGGPEQGEDDVVNGELEAAALSCADPPAPTEPVTSTEPPAPGAGGGGGARDIPPVPHSFLLAECGNAEKAFARWKATLLWREESGANTALASPHPRFDLIKKHYPTYFHGKDKTGAVVYYEQLGQVKDDLLRREGLDGKQMLWHYMYQMVYLWTVINPNDEDRVTTVLDLRGVTLATATKSDTVKFTKQCVSMMATHYPERSAHLLLLSWPRWFDWIYRFIRPLLSESTKSKMTSCTANSVYETLLSKIDNDQIPKEYGGASEYALGEHPYEVAMRNSAVRVLEENGVAMEHTRG
ncbi:unnamed protein product [Ectocarpus sp. 6 AP-2014]